MRFLMLRLRALLGVHLLATNFARVGLVLAVLGLVAAYVSEDTDLFAVGVLTL